MGFNPEDELADLPVNNSLSDDSTTVLDDIATLSESDASPTVTLDIDEYMNDDHPVTDEPIYNMDDLGLTAQLDTVPSVLDEHEDEVDETLMDLEQYRKHYRKSNSGGGSKKPSSGKPKKKKKKSLMPLILLLILLLVGGMTIYLGKSLKDKISDSSAETTKTQAASTVSTVTEEPEEEKEETGTPYYITGCAKDKAEKIYEEASSKSPVVTELKNGSEVLVTDEESSKSYAKVALDDGTTGYVRKSHLVSNPAFVATKKNYYVNVEESEKVALLEKVSAGSEKIGSLTTNQTVSLVAKASVKYWYVYSPDLKKYGYIDKDLIKAKKIKTEAQKKKEQEEAEKKKQEEAKKNTLKQEAEKKEETQPLQTEGTTYYVTGTTYYLALRNGSVYETSNEIAQLVNGVEVKVIQTGDPYWYVYVPSLGINGYCNGGYLTTTKPGSSNDNSNNNNNNNNNNNSSNNNNTSSKNIYVANVETSYLALRNAKAFDSANEIGKLYNGDKMEVLDSSTGTYWYVYVPSLGLKGYVNSNYIKKK